MICGDDPPLGPDRVAGGQGGTPDDDITDFAFGVAFDDLDGLGASHRRFHSGDWPNGFLCRRARVATGRLMN